MGIWYRAGTAEVTNGSPTVTGTLTAWLVYARPGDAITFDAGASWHEIADVVSNTEITLAANYGGSTASGLAYAINPSSYRHQIPSDVLEQLRAVLAATTHVFEVSGLPADDFGADSDLAFDFAALDLYFKSEGSWVGPVPLAYGDGHLYRFATSTTMADPGTGHLRLNHATPASATAIAIDDQEAGPGGLDLSAVIAEWDDSTNAAHRGLLTLRKRNDPAVFAVYRISGASTDNAGWTELAVTHVASAGTLAADDALAVTFQRTGDAGAAGAGDVDGPAASVDECIAVFDGTSGKLLKDGGQTIADVLASVTPPAAPTKQIFTSSGTWTKPAGCRFIKVTVVGGGGGGAGSANASGSQVAYGTSGGGGAVTMKWIDVTSIASETVTVGALGAKGAAGANNGSNGGASSFGSHAVAGGGAGGTTQASGTSVVQSNGAAGGAPSAGDVQFSGQAGGPFLRFSGTSAAMLCNGANGNFGAGGAPPAFNAGGNAASGYGCGGSGCASVNSGGAQAGGDGSPGLVIVEEFY